MTKKQSDDIRSYTYEDFMQHFKEILPPEKNISLVIETKNGEVFVRHRKVYSDKVVSLLNEAKKRFAEEEKAGLTHEEAAKRLKKVVNKINNEL